MFFAENCRELLYYSIKRLYADCPKVALYFTSFKQTPKYINLFFLSAKVKVSHYCENDVMLTELVF